MVLIPFSYTSIPALSPPYSLYCCLLFNSDTSSSSKTFFSSHSSACSEVPTNLFYAKHGTTSIFTTKYQLLVFLSNKTALALMSRKSRKADFTPYHYCSTAKAAQHFLLRCQSAGLTACQYTQKFFSGLPESMG